MCLCVRVRVHMYTCTCVFVCVCTGHTNGGNDTALVKDGEQAFRAAKYITEDHGSEDRASNRRSIRVVYVGIGMWVHMLVCEEDHGGEDEAHSNRAKRRCSRDSRGSRDSSASREKMEHLVRICECEYAVVNAGLRRE